MLSSARARTARLNSSAVRTTWITPSHLLTGQALISSLVIRWVKPGRESVVCMESIYGNHCRDGRIFLCLRCWPSYLLRPSFAPDTHAGLSGYAHILLDFIFETAVVSL